MNHEDEDCDICIKEEKKCQTFQSGSPTFNRRKILLYESIISKNDDSDSFLKHRTDGFDINKIVSNDMEVENFLSRYSHQQDEKEQWGFTSKETHFSNQSTVFFNYG